MSASSVHRVKAYNVDTITTCSYIGQLRLYRNGFVDKLEGVIANILKTPYRAFGKLVPFSPSLPHFPLAELRTTNLAALSRASWVTVE